MTAARTAGRSLLMASLTGILVLTDGALAALGWTVWGAHRDGHLTAAEAATFAVFGASAVLGVAVFLIALIAFARGAPGHRGARLASGLAWLRMAAVIVALMVIAIGLGASAVAGLLQTFGAVIAVADALVALIVTGAAVRRTRHE